MGFLGEKIGPAGFQSIHADYFPGLAVLDTEEILERIGKTWKNPGPSERHSVEAMDAILKSWVTFCDDALTGRQIGVDTIEKGTISGDSRSIESYLIFHRAIGNQEKYPEIITSVRDAFTILLSDDARKQIGKNKPRVNVDAKLRTKINQLITTVGHQADMHYSSLRRKLAAFEDD